MILQDLTMILQDLTMILQDLTMILQDLIMILQDLTMILQDLTMILQDLTMILQDLTMILQDLTMILQDLTICRFFHLWGHLTHGYHIILILSSRTDKVTGGGVFLRKDTELGNTHPATHDLFAYSRTCSGSQYMSETSGFSNKLIGLLTPTKSAANKTYNNNLRFNPFVNPFHASAVLTW